LEIWEKKLDNRLRFRTAHCPLPTTSVKFPHRFYRQEGIYGRYCFLKGGEAMYQAHWGLQKSPFRGDLDPKSFFPSPTHEEALARLNFLAEEHHRLGLLFGPAGSGK
jgi:type II secretory pathway predicted ATPase ExeA